MQPLMILSFNPNQLIMKKFLPAFFAIFILASCNDNTEKVADGMCDCYGKSSLKFSPDTKRILGKLSNSSNPKKTYTKEIEKLEEDEKLSVTEEIQQAAALSEDEELRACVDAVDKKYKVSGKDEKSALEKVVKHMESKGGSCKAWAGLIKLGLQAQDNANGDRDDDEKTSKPKKKPVTEYEEQ